MESKVRRGGPQEVVAYGHTYKSIVEFCNAYDLKYPNTSAQLRAGVEPEVVIETVAIYRLFIGPKLVLGPPFPVLTTASTILP